MQIFTYIMWGIVVGFVYLACRSTRKTQRMLALFNESLDIRDSCTVLSQQAFANKNEKRLDEILEKLDKHRSRLREITQELQK